MNWFRRFWYDLFKRNGWVVFRVLKFTSLKNRGMGQKDQHYPYSGCCLYTHALLSFVITEIKKHVLNLHGSGQPTPNAVTNNWAKWGPCACSLPLSASAKMAGPIRNVKFSTYFHSTSHMVSYQGCLLPSCPEPTLLFSVASENETHHTTIAVHDYSHSRETMCVLHTMQMGHLLIRQFPLTSLCRFRMYIM